MQNYSGAFYFGEFKPHSYNIPVMPIKAGIVSIFMPFNFVVKFKFVKLAKFAKYRAVER